MNAGYYHFRQIKSMKLHDLRPGYQFVDVVVLDGQLPSNQPGTFKDEFIWVTKDGVGTLVDEEATYRDYMEFQRMAHNAKVA